jgi:hypothetical protein
MNEYIDVRFRRKNKPLAIRRQLPDGVELDEADPIPRTVYVGFDAANEVTRYRLRRIRQLQGWSPAEFKLTMTVEDGALRLRGVDAFALPPGRYAVSVRIEEATTRGRKRTVDIPENGHGTLIVEVQTDDRGVEIDLTACDPEVQRVLAASTFDEEDAETWLTGEWRATRKACLLNLLACLRSRPSAAAPLIAHVERIFWISNDRAYARVNRRLIDTLEALARDAKKPFYREGAPRSPVHLRLLDHIDEPPAVRAAFVSNGLLSFRGEGRPSLQTVVAQPPPGLGHTYAEFDIDLGNALQDLAGFVTHMGELADGKPTNHLDLWNDLQRTKARDFLNYTVTA